MPLDKTKIITDWDAIYRLGTPPWDAGVPHAELLKVLGEKRFPKAATVLDVGCGSGADAIHLAKLRFEVTAIDCCAIAVERARLRAEQHDALLRFVLDDVFSFSFEGGCFEVVLDGGFYHYYRMNRLEQYLDMLWRVTKPGSLFFCLAGSTPSEEPAAPPVVTEDEIRFELGRLFEFVHLRPTMLESPFKKEGFPGWSILMRRPLV